MAKLKTTEIKCKYTTSQKNRNDVFWKNGVIEIKNK